jgi:hypothetical protein
MGASQAGVKGMLRPQIMKYFEEHIGVNVYVEDVARFANCDRDQAQSAINNLRRDVPEFPIQIVVRGSVYRYMGPGKPAVDAKPGKRVFEELAVTKAGDILIQDQDGAVYKAVEL